MHDATFELDTREFLDGIAAIQVDARSRLQLVLDAVGRLTVNHLRSTLPGVTVERIRWVPGGGAAGQPTYTRTRIRETPAGAVVQDVGAPHPGGWLDFSGNLASGYDHSVATTGEGLILTLSNNLEYAFWLEAMEGFWVLSGVTDPGGPVMQALEKALAEIAPEWRLDVGARVVSPASGAAFEAETMGSAIEAARGAGG